MAKSFKILQDQLNARLSDEQRAENEKRFQQMLNEINQQDESYQQDFEPDVIEWLQQQNAQTKHYINEMVRAVMKMQLQTQN